jgi:hypothetical protein
MELVGYYAELDAENIVTQVITGVPPTETIEGLPAAEWYSNFTGVTCVPTYIDAPNKTYAGIGYLYDYETQDFTEPYIPPMPDPTPEA